MVGPVAERDRPRVDVDRPRCPYCHEAVGGDDEKTGCGACMAWHHRACWSEHGACSACGAVEAAGAPAVVRSARRVASPPIHFGVDAYLDRTSAWVLVGVGVANMLLWGGFLLWSVVGGPQDLVAPAVFFFALGVLLAVGGLRALARHRADPS